MPALAEALRHICTTQACLRRTARIDLHYCPASILSFVVQFCDEARPSRVINRLRKHSASETSKVQVLDRYQPIGVDQGSSNMVVKVAALVSHMCVSTLQQLHGFQSAVRSSFASSHSALSHSQRRLRYAIVARVSNFKPIAQRRKMSQANIKSNSFIRYRQGLRCLSYRKVNVPFSALTFNGSCFNGTANRTMQLHLNESHALQSDLGLNQPTTVAVGRKGETVETGARLEPRESRFLSFTNAAKEGLKRFFRTSQYSLTRGKIRQRQIAISPNCFELVGLSVIINSFTIDIPRLFAFLYAGVIQPTGFRQVKTQHLNLHSGWKQSIAISYSLLSHGRLSDPLKGFWLGSTDVSSVLLSHPNFTISA